MVTTAPLDRTIPASISDNQLIKLIKTAFKHLDKDERLQFLALAGLPSISLERRIFCRLVRLAYYSNPDDRKAQFIMLLEKGIDTGLFRTSNFLSYEQHKQSA